MIQIVFFLIAILMGFYGAITGSGAALAIAATGMLLGASRLVTPSPTAQAERQQWLQRWLQRHGWLLFLLLAIGTTGLTLRQIALDEFSKSSGLYWVMTILLLVVAGIVHDREQQRIISVAADEDTATDKTTTPVTATAPVDEDGDQVATDAADDALPQVEQPTATPQAIPDRNPATDDSHSRETSRTSQAGFGLWFALRSGGGHVRRFVGSTGLDWLVVLVITLVALWLRLHQLNDFLPSMHGDEGEMGELARLAWLGPESGIRPVPLPLFGIGFLDHPTLFHYLQAAALSLFGNSLTGLRTLSALFGALCVPALYLLALRGWGRVAAITAAWLLAVSHLHIHYSRIALNNIQSVWAMILLVLLFVWAGERWCKADRRVGKPEDAGAGKQPAPDGSRAILLYLLAGLTIGISQYFYYGSRLLPVIAGLYVLLLIIRRQFTVAQFFSLGLATILPYAPLIYLYSRNWQSFLNRTQGVSSFSPEGMAQILGPDADWPQQLPLLAWEQFKRNMLFFIDSGDRSSFYLQDLPPFDTLTVVLFWLGLGLLLARIRRFSHQALFVWGSVGLLLGGILTTGSPYGPRLIVMVPAMFVIAALPLQSLATALYQLWPSAARWVLGLLLAVIGLGTLQVNYTTYFDSYQRFTPNLMPISMAHTIREHSATDTFYIYGVPNFYAEYSVLRFITPDSERYNAVTVDEVAEALEVRRQAVIEASHNDETTAPKGIFIIALLHRLIELDTLMQQFPGGTRQEHFSHTGQLLYVTYHLPTSLWLPDVVTEPSPTPIPSHMPDQTESQSTELHTESPVSPLATAESE